MNWLIFGKKIKNKIFHENRIFGHNLRFSNSVHSSCCSLVHIPEKYLFQVPDNECAGCLQNGHDIRSRLDYGTRII